MEKKVVIIDSFQFSKSVMRTEVSFHRHWIHVSGKSIYKNWVNGPFHDGHWFDFIYLFIHSANIYETPNIFQVLCIRLGAQDDWVKKKKKKKSWPRESLKSSRETGHKTITSHKAMCLYRMHLLIYPKSISDTAQSGGETVENQKTPACSYKIFS